MNPQQLKPKMIPGTPIRNREPQEQLKSDVKRRNAVLLVNDIHYARLLKKMSKSKEKEKSE